MPSHSKRNDVIRKVLDNYEYKPGWKFSARFDALGDVVLMAENPDLVDAYNPNLTIPVHSWYTVDNAELNSATKLEHYVLLCLRRLLKHLEEHEMDEWIHYRGKRIHDPHNKTVRWPNSVV